MKARKRWKKMTARITTVILSISLIISSALAGVNSATVYAVDGSDLGTGAAPVTSDSWTQAGNYDTSWYNKEATVFTLQDAADLAGLAFIVNNQEKNFAVEVGTENNNNTLNVKNPHDTFNGKTIKLAENATINLSGKTWTPIGTASSTFRGTFDGDTATIKGLKIQGAENGTKAVGLFGYTGADSTVQNINVTDADIRFTVQANGYYAGGIVGSNSGGTIRKCVFRGKIVADAAADTQIYFGNIGGIAGRSASSSSSGSTAKIENCTNKAEIISSVGTVGGIAGINGSSDSPLLPDVGTIEDCTNEGTIHHTKYSSTNDCTNAAGIAGRSYGTITNCENKGNVTGSAFYMGGIVARCSVLSNGTQGQVTQCTNDGVITGNYQESVGQKIGGIAGTFEGSQGTTPVNEGDAKIKQCVNKGEVSAVGAYSNMGGILGCTSGGYKSLSIAQCVNTGKITDGSPTTDNKVDVVVGGIAGFVTISNYCTIKECYNTGEIINQAQGHSTQDLNSTGGLIGYFNSASTAPVDISNCYNVGHITGYRNGGGLVGKAQSGLCITDCYTAGTVTKIQGGSNVNAAFGSIQDNSIDVTGCSYWNECGQSGAGSSQSANQMTSDENWSSNLGLDSDVWEKSNNSNNEVLTGYLPGLKNNKQNPAPTLQRTELQDRNLHITGKPQEAGTDKESFETSDGSFRLSVEDDSESGEVKWESGNPDVATVDSNGNVIITGAGQVTITASKAADDTYNFATDSYTFNVYESISSVTVKGLTAPAVGETLPEKVSAPEGEPYSIKPSIEIGETPGKYISWQEDGALLEGDTFASGKSYTAIMYADTDGDYHRFTDSVNVILEGVDSRYYTAKVEKENGFLKITVTFSHTHNWNSAKWGSNNQYHWHDCIAADCPVTDNSQKKGYASHREDNGTVTKEATETSTGIMTYKCSVCGHVTREETIPKLPASHRHSYGTEWKSDIDNHWHECGCGEKTDIAAHTEDSGTVTKAATETSEGIMTYQCSVCGRVLRTETIAKLVATDQLLLAKAAAAKTSNKLSWNKLKDADGYYIYASQCNTSKKTYSLKKVKEIKSGSTVSYVHKGLKNSTWYKYRVHAYKTVNGKKVIIGRSLVVHSLTTGSKIYTNPAKVTVSKKAITLKKGKSAKITAKVVLPKNKKTKYHTAKIRYVVSDKAIVSVSKSGTVKAKKAGSCTVYAVAQNGVRQKIKITVKQ